MKYGFTVYNSKFMYEFRGTSRISVRYGAFQDLCTARGRHHVNFPDAKYEAKGQTKSFPISALLLGPVVFKSLNQFKNDPIKIFISEVTCEYWQVLGFVVCIGMYGGMYCGTYWYVLTWYVLWHVLVCIIFGMYYMYW